MNTCIAGIESKYCNLGAEPTTADFTVVMHSDTYQAVDGIVLATDQKQQFSALEKYGQVMSRVKQIYATPCQKYK